jgi:hypothetical protein
MQTWSKTYGGTGDDTGYSVVESSDDGYVIVGETYSFGAGAYDIYFVKTDSAGNVLWSKTFGGAGNDFGESVVSTSDYGYVLAGYTSSFGAGAYDIYLVKTDSAGNMLWSKTYGGISDEYGHSVVESSDGGYVIAGETSSFGTGGTDAYLIKTDLFGNIN